MQNRFEIKFYYKAPGSPEIAKVKLSYNRVSTVNQWTFEDPLIIRSLDLDNIGKSGSGWFEEVIGSHHQNSGWHFQWFGAYLVISRFGTKLKIAQTPDIIDSLFRCLREWQQRITPL